MTDDAHGFGVLGDGRGSAAELGVKPDVQMGTLSKAVGGYGGYVCASRAVIDLMTTRARSLIYATALPPPVIAASIAGVDIIASDPALCAMPLAHARACLRALWICRRRSHRSCRWCWGAGRGAGRVAAVRGCGFSRDCHSAADGA